MLAERPAEAALRDLLPRGAALGRVAVTGGRGPVGAVVAVPARNEAALVEGCLASLARAAARAEVAVGAVVLVNNSTDATFRRAHECCRGLGLRAVLADLCLPPRQAHAGAARGLALDAALRLAGGGAALLTTDADARVNPGWIAANLRALAGGAALVCGRIEIDPLDAAHLPAAVVVAAARERRYLDLMRRLEAILDPDPFNPWPHHGAVGGASMATTGAAYMAVGGLPRPTCGEDRAFLARFRESDLPVVFSEAARVTVSGRIAGRAVGGMADAIAARLADPDAPIDERGERAHAWERRLRIRARARHMHAEGRGLAPLACALGLSPAAVRAVGAEHRFGAAWARIECAALAGPCGRLRPSDLGEETAKLARMVAAAAAIAEGGEAGQPPFLPAAVAPPIWLPG